jgi:hypothetical protein
LDPHRSLIFIDFLDYYRFKVAKVTGEKPSHTIPNLAINGWYKPSTYGRFCVIALDEHIGLQQHLPTEAEAAPPTAPSD